MMLEPTTQLFSGAREVRSELPSLTCVASYRTWPVDVCLANHGYVVGLVGVGKKAASILHRMHTKYAHV